MVKIVRFEIVTAFELDESIVLSCGPSLKRLQNRLGGRLLTINAPDDAPPQLPRVILKLTDTILNLALDRFQITTIPPSHVAGDITNAITFASQRASTITSELLTVISEYHWLGVIMEVNFPEVPLISKSAAEAAVQVFDKLIRIDRKNRPLASFQLQFGLSDDEYFITYMVGSYEGRKIELNLPAKVGYFAIEPSEYPLNECGIKILLDINNKPSTKKLNPKNDLNAILNRQSIAFGSLIADLNLEGIIE